MLDQRMGGYPNAHLMFKYKSVEEDYYQKMDHKASETWFKSWLLSNIPPGSFNCDLEDKTMVNKVFVDIYILIIFIKKIQKFFYR